MFNIVNKKYHFKKEKKKRERKKKGGGGGGAAKRAMTKINCIGQDHLKNMHVHFPPCPLRTGAVSSVLGEYRH